tara:strand:- start:13021 stop:15468 length:2448 start_codon:yes stop_codon:yes gene_type:complete
MIDPRLKELDVTNFRSIRGHVHAPLDANVVLIHGENGAGKTSLLSAIELALTGGVESLRRADPGYAKELLHRSASEGSPQEGNVTVKTIEADGERTYQAALNTTGAHSIEKLSVELAGFFGERSYLPQSLLGQLLQIYQEAGSDADSPLAKFVGDLLGLDRLDALEVGLTPLADVRNVRKVVDRWSQAEIEKSRFVRLLADQRGLKDMNNTVLTETFTELGTILVSLGLAIEASESSLDEVTDALSKSADEADFDRLIDQRRSLGSIQREVAAAKSGAPVPSGSAAIDISGASAAYTAWVDAHGEGMAALRSRIEAILPLSSLPSDQVSFGDEALLQLRGEHKRLSDQVGQVRRDLERLVKVRDEIEVARRRQATINSEISRIPSSAGSLGVALSELSTYIDGELCPVCDRDYSELTQGRLADHVHENVRRLSASAGRLLALGRSRGEQQIIVEQLEREIETLESRVPQEKQLANLDRQASSIDVAIKELEKAVEVLSEGARLRGNDVAARRAVSEEQSRNVSLAASRETLNEFALLVGTTGVAVDEPFDAAVSRLEAFLAGDHKRLEARVASRRRGYELVMAARDQIIRRDKIQTNIDSYLKGWKRADGALERAQKLRDDGNAIRNTVDSVRSGIIRREFNERLNRLWRDLFVRLAPGEPFVPAFKIPPKGTRRLQPKLITEYRDDGQAAGTPGAMLSAGNLNTAALSLFIALHLSVPKELPWLILDDPVQSMDDVHIAHFAALLRTLSKEHGRQVIIAVHDRQLFEYLRLELSPAFARDSLLTLELSRGPSRDTVCISNRLQFQEELVLLDAA